MKMNWKRGIGAWIPGLALAAGLSSQAFAQDIPTVRDELSRYRAQVERMQTVDTSKYSAEMSQIRSWLSEGDAQVASEDADAARNTAMRIGVYLEYVDTAMARDIVEGDAVAEEEKLKALRAEYGKIEAEVQQLQAEQDVLDQKLKSLTQK